MCSQIHHMGFFRQIHSVCGLCSPKIDWQLAFQFPRKLQFKHVQTRIENGPKVETAHPHPYRLYHQSCLGLQRYNRISILRAVVYILNVYI